MAVRVNKTGLPNNRNILHLCQEVSMNYRNGIAVISILEPTKNIAQERVFEDFACVDR